MKTYRMFITRDGIEDAPEECIYRPNVQIGETLKRQLKPKYNGHWDNEPKEEHTTYNAREYEATETARLIIYREK